MTDHAAILFKVGDEYRAETLDGATLAYGDNREGVIKHVIDRVSILFIDSSFQEGEKK